MSDLDELERLAALREKGFITEAQFEELKAKLPSLHPPPKVATHASKCNTSRSITYAGMLCGVVVAVVLVIYWRNSGSSPNKTKSGAQASKHPTEVNLLTSEITASGASPTQLTSLGEEATPVASADINRSAPEELAALCAELDACNKRSGEIRKECGEFRIAGDITDRERDSLSVYGKAIPTDNDYRRFGAFLADANIVVLHPHESDIRGGRAYYGIHYFVRKGTGKNGFGATVPVWFYGDPPAELKEQFAKAASAKQKILNVRSIYVSNILKVKRNVPVNNESALRNLLAFGAELEKISFRGIAPGESDSAIAKDATVRVTLIESRAYSDQVNPTVTKYNISGYPKEGVLILSSAYGTNEVGTVIYLIQADVLCEYYSFLREWGMNGSFTTQIPLDAPLLLQGSTAEYGWGGYYTPSTALPELCEGLYESKNGNRYVVLFRSDGKATDILAVTQSLRTGGGYWLLDARKADTDPIAQRRIKPEDTRAETQITVNAP